MKDVAYLDQLNYDLVVCDEAHKAKNLHGKTLATLKRYKADFRLLLTGTPLVRIARCSLPSNSLLTSPLSIAKQSFRTLFPPHLHPPSNLQ